MIWFILLLIVLAVVYYYHKIIIRWFHLFWAEKVKKYKFRWNPYKKYPVNTKCYCGSGRKYKKCCLHTEPDAIREDVADKAAKIIKGIRKAKKA